MSGTSGKKLDGSGHVWPEKHSQNRDGAPSIHDKWKGHAASKSEIKKIEKFEPHGGGTKVGK